MTESEIRKLPTERARRQAWQERADDLGARKPRVRYVAEHHGIRERVGTVLGVSPLEQYVSVMFDEDEGIPTSDGRGRYAVHVSYLVEVEA